MQIYFNKKKIHVKKKSSKREVRRTVLMQNKLPRRKMYIPQQVLRSWSQHIILHLWEGLR